MLIEDYDQNLAVQMWAYDNNEHKVNNNNKHKVNNDNTFESNSTD